MAQVLAPRGCLARGALPCVGPSGQGTSLRAGLSAIWRLGRALQPARGAAPVRRLERTM